MKSLTLEAYKLLHVLTGSRNFSYYVAIAIITVLNIIILSGLVSLLDGVLPFAGKLAMVFNFPINIGTGILLFFLTVKFVPITVMEIANHMQIRFAKLLIFAAIAALLLAYKIVLKIA